MEVTSEVFHSVIGSTVVCPGLLPPVAGESSPRVGGVSVMDSGSMHSVTSSSCEGQEVLTLVAL